MDGSKKKLPGSPVAQAAMRLFLADAGYEIKDTNEPKYPKSKRRQWVNAINVIIQHFPFSPKQKKLLKAFGKKQHLDSLDIKMATGSKDPTALIRDTRKRIRSLQHLKEIVAIKSYRYGQKWIYNLTIAGLEDLT